MSILERSLPPLRYYDFRKAYNGYTLFAPLMGKDVYLIDMQGRFVHMWQMPHLLGCHGRLLPNGNLLYGGKDPEGPVRDFGGSARWLREIDWNGNLVWEYEDPYLSHDFFRMDNGNTMVLKWTPIPDEVAAKIKGGIPSTERNGVIWSDVLHEINPKGEVVWEWLAYEHFDPEIDVLCPLCPRDRWGQANACYVMRDGNVIVSYAFLSQIQIVEKSTGNVIWRWGHGHPGDGRQPHQTHWAYIETVARKLGFPHNPTELDNGNILVFDNGRHRLTPPDYSRVIEINPTTNEIEWEYHAERLDDFYGSFMGSAQRLPNGNTLVCEAPKGRFFEVTPAREIVWEYVNPIYHPVNYPEVGSMTNMVFRAYRYGLDYPGLKGTGLDNVNLVYGSDALGSVATGLAASGVTIAPSTTGGSQQKPSVRSSGERIRSRLERLGY